MRKIRVLLLLLGIQLLFAQPVLSAQLFIDNTNTGIETVFVQGRNYIRIKDGAALVGQEDYKGDPNYLIPVKGIADGYYLQWDKEGIYLNTAQPTITRNIIGYSVQERPIEAVIFSPPNFTKTILCVFAIHGFEDAYNNDGQQLVEIAEQLITRYSSQLEIINFTRLIIVPCANPDGVYTGTTENGFGRCNAQGIDLNRDFDYNWSYIGIPRFQTGYKPFSAPESQILRDFVLIEKPDVVLDFHGWLNCAYSQNPELKTMLSRTLNLGEEKPADPKYNPWQGYFSGWASQYAQSALIEYPLTETDQLIEKTIQALDQLIQTIHE